MLNWAILGCGVVANEMAQAFENLGRVPYSVGNRTYDKAIAFAEKYGIKKVYANIDEIFADENVDVIYITTPHNTHIKYLMKAFESGKHVLCEKAITLNIEELELAFGTAKKNNLVLTEAMTIFHMPLYKKLYKMIIEENMLGKVNMIQLNFGSFKEYNMKNRFFNPDLAGGALLDIGVYALSFARLFMSSCPDEVVSQVKLAPTHVDESMGILLKNKDEQLATIALTLHSKQPKRATVSCDKGYIEIYEYPRAEKALITYTESGKQEEIVVGEHNRALQYEMEDMEKTINKIADLSFLQYTNDVMKIMTKIRKDHNIIYPEER